MTALYIILFIWLFWLVISQNKKIKMQEKRLSELEARLDTSAFDEAAEPTEMVEPLVEAVQAQDIRMTEAKIQSAKPARAPKQQKQAAVKPKVVPEWRRNLFSVESIISKLGILLLLIGVGYIFKLAYDKGYITEELAIVFGFLLGGGLIGLGIHVGRKHRLVLSQVLFGGGIATLYITVYAAYQGYGIIPGIIAFMLMCAITALGFALAMVTNSVAMSVIAILGGLMTPFVLQLEQLGLLGTGVYVLMIAIASTIIYLFKRWRLLQMCAVAGTYLVTSYFITLTGMTTGEKAQLALLMLALYILYNGTEYVLALIRKPSSKFPMITYGLFSALPLITLMQIWNVVELTDGTWSVLFGIVALVHLMLSYVLHKKDTDALVVNIALSHVALFSLFAVVLYFGGDIRVIAIAGLGLAFYALGKWADSWYAYLLAHLLTVIAFAWAIYELVEQTFDHEATWIELCVRALILVMFLTAAFLNKNEVRKVFGIAALEVYLLLVLQILMYQVSDQWEPLAVMVLVHGLYILLMYFINRRIPIVPTISIVVVSILPFLVKMVASMALIYTQELNGYDVVAFIIYSMILYLLVQFYLKNIPVGIRMMVKITVYSMVVLLLLTDLVIGTDYFVLGLLALGGVIFLLQFLEPDRRSVWLENYRMVLRSGWLIMAIGYILYGLAEGDFEWQRLLADMCLLPMLWLNLKYYRWSLPIVYVAGFQGMAFMSVTYGNFHELTYGRGIITLMWAAYAIALLAYSVVKANKQLVTLSLVFIVAVAAKYVMIDLTSVGPLWKIIISMAFGTALLTLSYFLQPILSGQKEKQ